MLTQRAHSLPVEEMGIRSQARVGGMQRNGGGQSSDNLWRARRGGSRAIEWQSSDGKSDDKRVLHPEVPTSTLTHPL